jgi:hypothetical protein
MTCPHENVSILPGATCGSSWHRYCENGCIVPPAITCNQRLMGKISPDGDFHHEE